MRLLTMLLALAALALGLLAPAPAVAENSNCPSPDIACHVDLKPASEPICYYPNNVCRIDVLNTLGEVPVTVTVRYKTFAVEQHAAADYVPVQEAVAVIEAGKSSGTATVQLVPKPPLPVEKFGLAIYAPSVGTISVPQTLVTITVRG
jgi:hypothetical protein